VRAGRIPRHLAAELPAIDEVVPQRTSDLDPQPPEELRLAADSAPRVTARIWPGMPAVPSLPHPSATSLASLAATAQRFRAGIASAALAALDGPTRAALTPRLNAATAMLREVSALVALRDEATGRARTGKRA
jgi:hypothetical protein